MKTKRGRAETMTEDQQVREMLNDPDQYFRAARRRADDSAKAYAKRLRDVREGKTAAEAS